MTPRLRCERAQRHNVSHREARPWWLRLRDGCQVGGAHAPSLPPSLPHSFASAGNLPEGRFHYTFGSSQEVYGLVKSDASRGGKHLRGFWSRHETFHKSLELCLRQENSLTIPALPATPSCPRAPI